MYRKDVRKVEGGKKKLSLERIFIHKGLILTFALGEKKKLFLGTQLAFTYCSIGMRIFLELCQCNRGPCAIKVQYYHDL